MPPVAVPNRATAFGRWVLGIVAVEPFVHIEDIALLRP